MGTSYIALLVECFVPDEETVVRLPLPPPLQRLRGWTKDKKEINKNKKRSQ